MGFESVICHTHSVGRKLMKPFLWSTDLPRCQEKKKTMLLLFALECRSTSVKERRTKLLVLPLNMELPLLGKGQSVCFCLGVQIYQRQEKKQGKSLCCCLGVWIYHSAGKRTKLLLLPWSVDVPQCWEKNNKAFAVVLECGSTSVRKRRGEKNFRFGAWICSNIRERRYKVFTFALECGCTTVLGKEGQGFYFGAWIYSNIRERRTRFLLHFCIGVWMYHSVRKRRTMFLL